VSRDPWWVRMAPTLAGPAMIVGTLAVLIVLAAAGDAPVFVLVAVAGTAVVLWLRRRAR
jgi:hypothetical protein